MSGARLAIVTGKGGVGKTTVAAALARAAADEGRKVLVAEVATPGRLAGVLDTDDLPSEPVEIRRNVHAVSLDETRALENLVENLLPLKLLSRRLLSSDTFRIVAAAVPGILEVALLAQIARWMDPGTLRNSDFDLVILDAPASGHSVPLLSSPRTLANLTTIGPLGDTVRRLSRALADPERTMAFVVALPEQWAVGEAIELMNTLRNDLEVPVARPLLNATFPRRFSKKDEELVGEAGRTDSIDPQLLHAGRYFVERRRAGQEQLKELRRGTGLKPVELPFVFSSTMAWNDLDPIANALRSGLSS